jgi:hypothetical protein
MTSKNNGRTQEMSITLSEARKLFKDVVFEVLQKTYYDEFIDSEAYYHLKDALNHKCKKYVDEYSILDNVLIRKKSISVVKANALITYHSLRILTTKDLFQFLIENELIIAPKILQKSLALDITTKLTNILLGLDFLFNGMFDKKHPRHNNEGFIR